MATSVRFAAVTVPRAAADPCALEPAPSLRDWDCITAGLEGVAPISGVDALFAGGHVIRGDYRAWTMWLYPNVRFYRDDPKTEGGQGMAGWPSPGMQENVTLRIDGEKFAAVVEFV